MENIDIIIVAGVSFLLVVGGLFIGMYFARRAEAERAARLEEREERVLRMRAKLEHDRFSVSSEDSDDDDLLDEDLFKGFKEELEQERMELDMRREELELDMRMLEEENDRLKSRLTGTATAGLSIADEATIVHESAEEPAYEPEDDIEDAVFADAHMEDETNTEIDEEAAAEPLSYSEDALVSEQETDPLTELESDAEDEKARNTIFGDFFFDEDASPDFVDQSDEENFASPDDESAETGQEPVPTDEKQQEPENDGWSSEPDEPEAKAVDVKLTEPVGGDGAALASSPEADAITDDSDDTGTPLRPAFDHMLTADGEPSIDGSVEQVLGLSKSDLALMNDLGYGTFRSIADLGDEEITRLAEAFDIPEQTIRDEWIPDSRMRVAREPRA